MLFVVVVVRCSLFVVGCVACYVLMFVVWFVLAVVRCWLLCVAVKCCVWLPGDRCCLCVVYYLLFLVV